MKINNACSLAGSAVLSSDFSDGYTQESAGRQLGSNFATLLMMSPQRSIQLLVFVCVCLCLCVCLCVCVHSASHSYNSITHHGRELGRLDWWLLSTRLHGHSFLHRPLSERYETVFFFLAHLFPSINYYSRTVCTRYNIFLTKTNKLKLWPLPLSSTLRIFLNNNICLSSNLIFVIWF